MIKIVNISLLFILVFIFGCDKEVSRTPVEPPPAKGFVYVQSSPSGFTIFQDGRNTGRLTPDSLRFLEAGDYEITLKKKYFNDTSVTVNVTEDNLAVVNVDYFSNPSMFGNLSLFSNPPGAEIVLNDSSLNRVTPDTLLNLLPGEYKVTFKLFNFRDSEIDAIVQSSKTNVFFSELRDTSLWVDYQVFNSGIQSNSLTAAAIDNFGIKWIGTLDAGLISFDDISFTKFDVTNSPIPSNKINTISVDDLNNIWVGTDLGIAVYNSGSWIIYNRDNSGLTSEIINSIRFSPAGIVWIGTAGNLVKFDGATWQVFNEPLGRDWIMDIYIENESKLWLGTFNSGIFGFENETYIQLPDSVYMYPTNSISSIEADQIGNLWFCFLPTQSERSGISYWDGSSFNNFILGNPENKPNNIFIDNQNHKWISTSEGLVHYDAQNNSETFTTLNSLISSDLLNASVRDMDGNIWITTIGGGLNKFKVYNLK